MNSLISHQGFLKSRSLTWTYSTVKCFSWHEILYNPKYLQTCKRIKNHPFYPNNENLEKLKMSLQTEADDRLLGFSDSDLLLLYNLLSGKAQTGCWTGGKTQRVWETASFSQSLKQSALNSAENLLVLHVWAALLRIHPSFTLFIPAGANKTMPKKSSNLCVKSAEMYLVQRESLTSLLHVGQRLCQLRKWVFHPADASCLGTLSGAHPAAASRGSGSAHRSRKKRSLKNPGI